MGIRYFRLVGLVWLSAAMWACGDSGPTPSQRVEHPEPAEHRVAAGMCNTTRPTRDWTEQLAIDRQMGWGPIQCTSDSECTDQADGRCVRLGDGYYACSYHPCQQDTDCPGAGEVCECGVGPLAQNACLKADCRIDADCGSGRWCSPVALSCPPEFSPILSEYHCVTTADECVDDEDCRPCPGAGACDHPGWCGWDAGGAHRVCAYNVCVR